MSNFNLQVAINSTSIGQTTTNFLYNVFLKKLEPNIFPIGGIDISAFEEILPQEFIGWLQTCTQKAMKDYKRSYPSLKIWHINGSHETVSDNAFLYFFHELDQITSTEKNILSSYEGIASPCKFTSNVCEEYGITNCDTINLQYDSTAFKPTSVKKYENNEIVIAVVGKFEKRKHSGNIIQLLKNKFGNNSKFKIHLHTFNPFFDNDPNKAMEINKQHIIQYCGGDVPHNFIMMPHVRKLVDLNKMYNMVDIVVDGSGGESWSLPSFHIAGLGKQCVVNYNSGIKEWSTSENSLQVQPNGKISSVDGLFFRENNPFNCGNIYDLDTEEMSKSIDLAVENVKNCKVNEEGKRLPEKFTEEKFCDELLNFIKL
jgi:hypothetical protein